MLPRSSRPRAAWGTGVYPSKQYFDIKMRCLRQRRHRRRWYLKGADNTPYEKNGDEVRPLADEVPFDIPDSWEWVRLGELFQHNTGKALNAANCTGQLKQYITTSNLYWDRFELNNLKEMYFSESEIEKCTVIKGDLLVCEGGDIGRASIWSYDYPMCIQNHIHRLRAYVPLCTRFFYYLFDLYKHIGWIGGKGIGIQGLSSNAIHSLLFPLPPLAEQHRIVETIDKLQPYTDAYADVESTLDTLNTTFPERLKKSILQEAVQGKLVPQDSSDEPAEALLERIRAEKQRLIKEGKIKKDKHESVIFRRDNSHYEKRGSKEENINDIIPFELPDSWEWIRLSAILTSTDAGKSPQCENRPRTIGEWGVIKTTAIQDGYFLAEENKVLPLDFNLQESMVVHHGDLLITRAGPRNRTGVICVVDGEPENLILSDKTVRLSYLRNFVNPHYVMTALSSPAMQYFVVDAMTGMASSQVNISQEKMKTFLLPLPPLNEQQRIVDEVSKIFGRIDKLNF